MDNIELLKELRAKLRDAFTQAHREAVRTAGSRTTREPYLHANGMCAGILQAIDITDKLWDSILDKRLGITK